MNSPRRSGKTLSSGLLGMKFMQRAAASAPTPSPATAPDPPSKRRKVSKESAALDIPDLDAVQAAIAAEELKRAQAIERQAAVVGETRWALSFKDEQKVSETPLNIVMAGYASIDTAGRARSAQKNSQEGLAKPEMVGRRVFGKLPQREEKTDNAAPTDSSGPVSAENGSNVAERDGQNLQSPSKAGSRARAELDAQRAAEREEGNQLASQRRAKEINLNQVTSISSGGGQRANQANIKCHRCGQMGHMKNECPRLR